MVIHFFYVFGIVWISASPKIFEKPKLSNVNFFTYFSRIMRIHVAHVLGIIWIFPSAEIFKQPINLKCLCFPTFFPYYGNPLFLCFGNCMNCWTWIYASYKKFKKPLTLKCLYFPIFFPYCGNSVFPYFENCMDFCVTQNIWETHNFGFFVFSHTFPLLWEITFRIFWELYGFLLHPKYLRNP